MTNSRPEKKKPQVLQHPGLRGNVEIYEETNVMHDNSTDVADVTPETVPAMVYAGHPVVTTALLARLYGAEAKHIQNNYARNNARFESGKHFFKVEGADLADLKNKPSLRGFVGVKAKSLILWTERGAARHAKMLETNEAWDVFEKLEDCYFGKFESARQVPAPANQTLLGTTIGTDGFHCLAAVVDGKVRHLPARMRRGAKNHIWSQVHKAFSVVSVSEPWQGIWLPFARLNYMFPMGTTASDIGQIPGDGGDYLRFLLMIKSIGATPIAYREKLKMLDGIHLMWGSDGHSFSEYSSNGHLDLEEIMRTEIVDEE
ncbi:ORF6N domain-containing protein [Pseudomonas aeruginosa]